MKKLLTFAVIILLFFSIVFPIPQTPLKAEVTLKESKIVNVSVDPRIELLSAVQLLSNYFILTQLDFQYKKEMLDYFSPFKSHPAVTKFIEMSSIDFNYDAPPTAMLFLSNPPELKIVTPFTDYIIGRAGGKDNLESFIEDLRDFAIKSNFMDFFNSHKDFYSILIKDTGMKLGDYKDVSTLESFYGISQNSYNIILAPLFHNGGYGPEIKTGPSKYDIYGIIGPSSVSSSVPFFSSEESLRDLVWHEFSHSFVNPITGKYIDEVNKYSNLFLPLKDIMETQAYTTWEICVNEHIVRAVVAKFTEKVSGQDAAETVLSNEVKNGFVYIRGIYDLINVYENNRDKYPAFEDFSPEILNYFSEISKLPLLPMDFKVTEQNQKKVVLIWRDTSDNEEGFKIYRKANNEAGFKLIATLKRNQYIEDNKLLRFLFKLIAALKGNRENFVDTTIEPGKTYSYKVSSFNENGENFAPEDVTVAVPASLYKIVLVLQIGDKTMYVNDIPQEIDVSPQIIEGRTYLPISCIAGPLGATVGWDGTARKVTVKFKKTVIELWVNRNFATVNGTNTMIDLGNPKVGPEIINNRTMLPIRFVAENLGCKVDWEPTAMKITITYQAP